MIKMEKWLKYCNKYIYFNYHAIFRMLDRSKGLPRQASPDPARHEFGKKTHPPPRPGQTSHHEPGNSC